MYHSLKILLFLSLWSICPKGIFFTVSIIYSMMQFTLSPLPGTVTGQKLKVTESSGNSVHVHVELGKSGGAIYTRWGKSSCPHVEGTKIVYSGITGGTFWNQPGGGANYLCMPKNPEYSYTLKYRSGVDNYGSDLYGTEYQYPLQGLHDHNVPCAVCHVSTRPTVLMIPAKTSCPPTWTREYYGYLMSTAKADHHYRTMFECVDKDQESLPGTHANTNGAVFYHVEANCGTGIPCLPYNNHQELNCVVCTN